MLKNQFLFHFILFLLSYIQTQCNNDSVAFQTKWNYHFTKKNESRTTPNVNPECTDATRIKDFFFYWSFLYWILLISYRWVSAHTKIKRQDKWKTQKPTNSLSFSGPKLAKDQYNVPVFWNFLTKEIMLGNSWFFYFRQESFFLSRF